MFGPNVLIRACLKSIPSIFELTSAPEIWEEDILIETIWFASGFQAYCKNKIVQPKLFEQDQNILVQAQNNFEPIEGQDIKQIWFFAIYLLWLMQWQPL